MYYLFDKKPVCDTAVSRIVGEERAVELIAKAGFALILCETMV